MIGSVSFRVLYLIFVQLCGGCSRDGCERTGWSPLAPSCAGTAA